MSQEGADSKLLGNFSKKVTQVVMVFGAETWVLTPSMERALGSFQHMVVQRLTGRKPRRRGGWELVIPTIGVGNGGIRLKRDRGVHHEEAEHD